MWPGRLRRALAGLALALGAVALTIGAFELALRALGIAYPELYRDDPVLGRAHLEGASGWWAKEGGAWVAINSGGLRDRDRPVAKPAGTFRVAVLGDSYAAAFEVPLEAGFTKVLERELRSCPALAGREVDVLNFGLAGAGTATEYLMLEDRVWKYAPDLVLLAFLTANDIADNSRALKGAGRAPYFVLDGGRLVLEPEFLERRQRLRTGLYERARYALAARSRTLQLWDEAWRRVGTLGNTASRPVDQAAGPEPGLAHAIYTAPTDTAWIEAWRVTEALFAAIVASSRAHGTPLALAVLSDGIQVDPDAGKRARAATAVGATDLFWPDRRVAVWAADRGVPHVLLAPRLQSWAEANRTCVHGFANAHPCGGHWNEHGHKLAGEHIAAMVCSAIAERASATLGAQSR